jgi:hypothetical protein
VGLRHVNISRAQQVTLQSRGEEVFLRAVLLPFDVQVSHRGFSRPEVKIKGSEQDGEQG